MRLVFSVIFMILAAALLVCAVLSCFSKKPIGKYVAFVEAALIFPIVGNLIIVYSDTRKLSMSGYYIYFVGMDFVIAAMVFFAFKYCKAERAWYPFCIAADVLLLADAVQLIFNRVKGHAFSVDRVWVDHYPYYRQIAKAGLVAHRIIIYGILITIIFLFLRKTIKTPRIYAEKYSAILITMLVTTVFESFYVFSRTPVDISMTGFGIFGIVLYYFALIHRPLKLLDRMLSDVASGMIQAMFFYDAHGRCIWVNESAGEMVCLEKNKYEEAGYKIMEIFPDLPEGNDWSLERTVRDGDEIKYYTLEKQSIFDKRGKVTGTYLCITDDTIDKMELATQKYNATHDSLTDLYNREYLLEKIRLTCAENPEESYYIGILDARNFKLVNDIFGYRFGDYTIVSIANVLRKLMSENCVYGRIAGDRFGFLMPKDELDADSLEKALDGFIVKTEDRKYPVLLHIGLYEIVDREIEISVMVDRAILALTTIKDDFSRHVAFYDSEMRQKVLWERGISGQLAEALEQKQITPYFQPIVDNTGKVVGAEALVRWIHPKLGFMSPGSFIPIFEKNGMIAQIDRYMWRCACEKLAEWEKEGNNLFLSVNISPKDFYFMDVEKELCELVKEYGIFAEKLRVEITETMMMSDMEKRMDILKSLKNSGFIVEMDDFGSGYSSLNLLKDMPVDVLKIDMMFVIESKKGDVKAQTILQNIIKLSDDLRIMALTEGVETKEQYELLSGMGCKLFQGFYFAKPMPMEEFEEFRKKGA